MTLWLTVTCVLAYLNGWIQFLWTVQRCYHVFFANLKVVGNQNYGGSGRCHMLGFDLPLWWSTFIFILIWPPSWNNSISFSAYYSRLNRHRLNDKAWCCKQLGSLCTAPIYWCCKPVSTNILVLQTFKKSASCKMPVCIRLLALQALVAPIYWCCEHRSTNILVLPAHVAPISAHKGLFTTWWTNRFLADFFTIINYKTPCFLYGNWYGSKPTPSPVSKGRNQIYSVIRLHSHPPLPPANRKIFKKEKCRKYLQHHALSFKRCLFNLL